MDIMSFFQLAVTPGGSPDPVVSMPVAPVVECNIGDNEVFIHNIVTAGTSETVFSSTTIDPTALILPHPPVNSNE